MFFKILVDPYFLISTVPVLEGYRRRGGPGLTACCFARAAFPEKNHVRDDIRPGIFLESRLGKTNRPEKVRPVGKVIPRPVFDRIHGVPACDKHKETSGLHPVNGFSEKIVMKGKPVLGILSVRNDLG